MPANGRWDLIRRLKVKQVVNFNYSGCDRTRLQHHISNRLQHSFKAVFGYIHGHCKERRKDRHKFYDVCTTRTLLYGGERNSLEQNSQLKRQTHETKPRKRWRNNNKWYSYPAPLFHYHARVFSSHYRLVQRRMLTRVSGLSSLQADFVISVAIYTGQPNIDRRSAPAFGQQMSWHKRKLTSSTMELTEADIAAPAVRSSLPPGQ